MKKVKKRTRSAHLGGHDYLELGHRLNHVYIADILVVDCLLYRHSREQDEHVCINHGLPRSSSYSVSRAEIRDSSSSRLRVVSSFSSWLCRRRSTVSRMSDCPSASCRRTVVMSSYVSVDTPVSESIVSSFARIWRSCSSFSENVPCYSWQLALYSDGGLRSKPTPTVSNLAIMRAIFSCLRFSLSSAEASFCEALSSRMVFLSSSSSALASWLCSLRMSIVMTLSLLS